MRWFRESLTVRLVLVTVGVAVLGAVATVGVAYQLVRTSTVQQSQQVLRSTAEVVANAPAADRAALVRNLDRSSARGIRLVLLRADGSTVPASESIVPPSAVSDVRTNGTVSERVRHAGRTFLLEGVRGSGGDAVVAAQDFSLVRSAIRRLLDRFLLATAAGAALAAVIGVVVAQRVVRPLRRFAGAARRMADGERGVMADGERGTRADGERGVLAHGERGAPSTSGHRASSTVGLHAEPVAELAAIGEALASLDVALQHSEARQREFLLSVSHEIRTPLTGIRGYADALADGLVPADALPGVGRTLVRETGRLDAFVRDLLELARLQADDFAIRPERFDLRDVVRDSFQAWRATAGAVDVRLTVDVPPGGEALACDSDPMRVRQLLDGLLENALRASPPGSTVHLVARRRADRFPAVIEVRVFDEGPGLTAADTDDAFERGVLANRYRNTRTVGTGLGLSIAARLVRRLDGRIEAGAWEHGAVFTVSLRAAPDGGRRTAPR